ncbi:fumarylacetoacetase [Candidatus Njordibacter sp. Uisw_056]|jgi:fumarylacetoacetase|uniref:fumarylacetoacetase n=1 Tax=Candidatus Njordibacter sp. Uisw_056 TaxID=3230973 RepID=UPI003D5931F1|tara:strand:- start:10224 stop:11498 length:1275 start_codon:yes stop_codon:yes gene_type:complete
MLNATHDPSLISWLTSANNADTDFPIQNLPFGAFTSAQNNQPHVGVAIGDDIVDLYVLAKSGLLDIDPSLFDQANINKFMAQGSDMWTRCRRILSQLLSTQNLVLQQKVSLALVPQNTATLLLPIKVEGYTDFYASKEHATNVGTMFRDPENALMPNWLHIPIGYNGRASTVVVSGTDVRRPLGQLKLVTNNKPHFGPTQKLDIELEMGAIVGTPNEMGTPLTVDQAQANIFGFVLLNDWSARDVQVWEYQPLGPFQAKAFATTISPWVVTQEALQPFCVHGPEQHPKPLGYLAQTQPGNYNVELQVDIQTQVSSLSQTISQTNFRAMYWSSAQQLTHHSSSGCAMQTGDLLGSGTISGSAKNSLGSLLELTWNGQNPLPLANGEERRFVEDGDTLTLRGHCQGQGYRIGFGSAVGKILPAHRL